jgi:hypothetical protein
VRCTGIKGISANNRHLAIQGSTKRSFNMTEQIHAEKQPVERDMNRDPISGTPGAHPVGTGIGAAGGAAAGAAVGLMAGGPIGTAVGGIVGAVMGGLAGKGVGEVVNPTLDVAEVDSNTINQIDAPSVVTLVDPVDEDLYWQRAFITEPYYNSELTYDDYAPAYRTGYTHRQNNASLSWEQSEQALKTEWERNKGESHLGWDDAYHPVRAAWFRADTTLSGGDPYFGVT